MPGNIVTVFGGTGFLGRRAVRRLAAAGWEVCVASRHPAGRGLADGDTVRWQHADIGEEDTVTTAVAGATAVVNALSLYVETARASFEAIHGAGAERLARCAGQAGVERLVHISGLGADPRSPSRYVAARGRGEARVRAAYPAATVLRPSVLFGPDDAFLRSLDTVTRLPVVPLFGRGETRLQPVDVEDVAAAIVRSLQRPETAGRVFELGGGAIYTYREIAQQVLAARRRRRLLMPIPFGVWRALARGAAALPSAPLTPDQVALMAADNVVDGTAAGFAELGIRPARVADRLSACLPDPG